MDWIVVNVVVKDREEWFDEEKMLFAPPDCELIAPPAALLMPDFDWPVSEWTVSGFVASVGAADLLLASRGCCPSSMTGREVKLLPLWGVSCNWID